MKQLLLGGARSGKSRYAESLAEASGKQRVYIATGEALDAEMAARIALHRQQRDGDWQTLEVPIKLAACLRQLQQTHPHAVVLVDCLTLWLNNCLANNCWPQERDALLALWPDLQMHCILVSNEVGSGVVPLGPLSRTFVDESGRLHQQLAQNCDSVQLLVAGLPLTLKQEI